MITDHDTGNINLRVAVGMGDSYTCPCNAILYLRSALPRV